METKFENKHLNLFKVLQKNPSGNIIYEDSTSRISKIFSVRPEDIEQIKTDLDSWIRIDNPFVVKASSVSFFNLNGLTLSAGIQMEKMNMTLSGVVQKNSGMNFAFPDFFGILLRILTICSFLEKVGTPSKNIKLSNFMFSSAGKLKISDLGFSSITNSASSDLAPELRDSTTTVPTEAWFKNDIWRLGMLFIQIALSKAFKDIKDMNADLELVGIHYGEEIVKLIRNLTDSDPNKRPLFREALSDLKHIIKTKSIIVNEDFKEFIPKKVELPVLKAMQEPLLRYRVRLPRPRYEYRGCCDCHTYHEIEEIEDEYKFSGKHTKAPKMKGRCKLCRVKRIKCYH